MSIAVAPDICRLEGIELSQHEGELRQLFVWLDGIRPVNVFVEIGSRYGGSFYALAKHLEVPSCCISVDLPGADGHSPATERSVARVVEGLRSEGFEVHQIIGDSHVPATVEQVKRILDGRPVDFLFIDGDHTAVGVLKDIDNYVPLVRAGGMVALHDVGEPYGEDAVSDQHMGTKALDILSDVNAAFTRLARGRRWAKIVHKWGIGVVWV